MEHPLLSPASSYDELWRQVDFATMDIPERFNLGVACADRQDPARAGAHGHRGGPDLDATTRSAR